MFDYSILVGKDITIKDINILKQYYDVKVVLLDDYFNGYDIKDNEVLKPILFQQTISEYQNQLTIVGKIIYK